MLDIFNNDAFSVVSLTDVVNKMPYLPGQVGRLNLFVETGVSTTTVALDEKNGVLSLIKTSARGAPGMQNTTPKSKTRSFKVPHLQLDDSVMADEVQNVRALGSQDRTVGVQEVVNQKLAEMVMKHDLTLENMKLGAIRGIVLDSDGSTLFDLFSEFGISANATVDFNLDASNPASGVLKKTCASIVRTIASKLGGVPFTGIHALVGKDFMDDLQAHKEVRETYLNTPSAATLRENGAFATLRFGGIDFEEYRGVTSAEVGGQGVGIADGEAQFFPKGVPGLFRQWNAPADLVETVNTIGLPRYARQYTMPNGKGINLETQANPLVLCTRPEALVKGTRT
jgi:hypothetical protein